MPVGRHLDHGGVDSGNQAPGCPGATVALGRCQVQQLVRGLMIGSKDQAHAFRNSGLGPVRGLLSEAAAAGDVRTDVDPDELAQYCLHALNAAAGLPTQAAVDRLITVTLNGLGAQFRQYAG